MSKEHNGNENSGQPRSKRPSLDFLEIQRLRRLHAVRRQIEHVLRHDASIGEEVIARLHEPLTRLVSEVAILDRVTNAADGDPYQSLLADTLGIDPWVAIDLWNRFATAPIEAFAARWVVHQEQAARRSEPTAHRHAKLVDLADISAILGLTRPRIREIFGAEKCVLPPVKMRHPRFSPETLARLRLLSREIGKTPEYLGDVLARGGEDALTAAVAKWQAQMMRRNVRKAKAGPKRKADGVSLSVRQTAKQLRVSESTIWRRVRVTKGLETPESAVTSTVNSCHNDSELLRSVTPEFSPYIANQSSTQDVEFELSDTELALASVGTSKSKRRKRYKYNDRALVIEWWTSKTGQTPSDGQIRQWASRGKYAAYLMAARAWRDLNAIKLADATPYQTDEDNTIIVGDTLGASTRPLRTSANDPRQFVQEEKTIQGEGIGRGRGV